MSNSVDCAAIMDSIMTGGVGATETSFPLAGLRLGMPVGYLFDGLDDAVATSFDEAVQRLSAAGATISEIRLDVIEELRPANNPKSIVAAEAFALHRERLLSDAQGKYDPFVASRIKSGGDILAADYINQFAIRRQTIRLVQQQTRFFDVLLMPTSPIIPPKIKALSTIDAKLKMSGMALRNTALANFLDNPTITIPCHKPGTAPVGLSLMGLHKHDRRLLAIAAGAEATIRG